jgi:hypothetical protein
MNIKKAMIDKTARSAPVVLFLAKVMRKEAKIIRPMAIKEAHILSSDDIIITPIRQLVQKIQSKLQR